MMRFFFLLPSLVTAYFDSLLPKHRGASVWLEDYDCYFAEQDPLEWNKIIRITKEKHFNEWYHYIEKNVKQTFLCN